MGIASFQWEKSHTIYNHFHGHEATSSINKVTIHLQCQVSFNKLQGTTACTDEFKDKQEKEQLTCCISNVKIVTQKTQMFSMLCWINVTGYWTVKLLAWIDDKCTTIAA